MNTIGKKLAITGAALQLGPILGLVGTIIGMISAFLTMGSAGMEQPEALADDIGFALITTAIGLCVGIVGLILMLVALFGSKYRAPWFFWFLMVWSVLWMLNIPVGTILGVGLLIYLITHKAEFNNQTQSESEAPLESADQVDQV